MLKKIIGYFLAVTGVIGFEFLGKYNGELIPYPVLWCCLSLAISIAGFYLIYLSKSNTLSKQEKYTRERLSKLKLNGDKILLTVDNCEIRENNYYVEVNNESNSTVEIIDALHDSNRNQQDFIEQSAIIYYLEAGDKKLRLTSQSFPFNAKTLTNYIEDNQLVLYVNRSDESDYVFEFLGKLI